MAMPERSMRRLLVALDARPDYRPALQRGAQLARALGVELGVLFIEDVSLFHLCELPTAEIALGTRRWRRIETGNLERELRVRAAEARATLEQVAGLAHLRWSFDVWRGHAAEAVHEAARHADLVSLAWAPRPLLASARRSTSRHEGFGSVVALYEAGADNTVLDVALNLARATATTLHVIAVGETAADAAAERHVAEAGVAAPWRRVGADRAAMLAALGELHADLLVLAAESRALSSALLADLIDESGAQALLVRDGKPG